MELKNRVALITGGARRVGKEISTTLAAKGVRVAIHYHSSEDESNSVVTSLRDAGHDVTAIPGDFLKLSDVERVVEKTFSHYGRIDFLINNAALYYPTPVGSTREDEWDSLIAINLKAPYFCAQAVSKHFRRAGSGKIINIADVSAFSPWPDFITYCVSKAGLISMTKGLAKALAPDIQVNAIASGTVLMGEEAGAAETKAIAAATLLKRIGSPADIANTVSFLLESGDYITGAVIPVDGGALIK